ncbi:hypothetical protein V5799_017458, partial [Amblyomma americanum]
MGEAKKMLRLARGALPSRELKARSHLLHEPCRARFALPDPATAESSATASGRNSRRQALFRQAHSRVHINSRRYLVAADWLLGKFGRRQLREHIAWWFTQICALMASRKAKVLIAGDAECSEVLKTARCIDLATAWFGPALYYTTDTWYFTAEKRRAVNNFLHGVTVQTQSSFNVMTWIDERKRRIMERWLRDLRVLARLEQLQSSAAPGLDQSSGFFSNFWKDPKKSTIARHLSIERVVLATLSTGVNETGRAAVHTTVARLEPLFKKLNGYPLPKAILSAFNASGIHAHSRVYISSRGYLVSADWLLGKFGRQQLREHIAWSFALICAVMASRKARVLIAGDGKGSEVLKTARCIDLTRAWFGPALYYATDMEYFTTEKRRAVNSFLHALTLQMLRPLTAMTWIDERTRRIMERKLRDLRVLAWLEQLQSRAAPWLDQSSGDFSNFWIDPKKASSAGDSSWSTSPGGSPRYCAMMASRKARFLIEGDAEGSEVLKTARCIDLATAWFGPALYYATDMEYFTTEKRRAVNSFLHGLTLQMLRPLTATTWIDERTRRIMERKLRDLRVLAWLEQLQSRAAPGLDKSSGAFANFWKDPKK